MKLMAVSPTGKPQAPIDAMPNAIAEVLAQTRSLYERQAYIEPWISYIAVEDARAGGQAVGQAVGLGAFKSAPENGRVEIAYMTAPEFEGRGVATAIARALIAIARDAAPRLDIRAQTLPVDNASVAILKKLGFTFAGDVQHPEDGLVWEWRLAP